MKSGIELANSLSVGDRITQMNLAVAVRIGDGSRRLHHKIGLAGDGIVVSGERLKIGKLGIAHVGVQVEGAIAEDMTMFQVCRGIEIDGGGGMAQNRVVKSDGIKRNLDGCRKRIPVTLELLRPGGGRQVYVEIVDQHHSGELWRRERTAHGAVESRVAIQYDGPQRWATNGGDKGQPVSDAG